MNETDVCSYVAGISTKHYTSGPQNFARPLASYLWLTEFCMATQSAKALSTAWPVPTEDPGLNHIWAGGSNLA